ncbi:unnamed protein product, partial [Prorocentrum cordatum]
AEARSAAFERAHAAAAELNERLREQDVETPSELLGTKDFLATVLHRDGRPQDADKSDFEGFASSFGLDRQHQEVVKIRRLQAEACDWWAKKLLEEIQNETTTDHMQRMIGILKEINEGEDLPALKQAGSILSDKLADRVLVAAEQLQAQDAEAKAASEKPFPEMARRAADKIAEDLRLSKAMGCSPKHPKMLKAKGIEVAFRLEEKNRHARKVLIAARERQDRDAKAASQAQLEGRLPEVGAATAASEAIDADVDRATMAEGVMATHADLREAKQIASALRDADGQRRRLQAPGRAARRSRPTLARQLAPQASRGQGWDAVAAVAAPEARRQDVPDLDGPEGALSKYELHLHSSVATVGRPAGFKKQRRETKSEFRLHVGFYSLRPYKPEFHRMERFAVVFMQQATTSRMSEKAAMELLSEDGHASATWYQLGNTIRSIPRRSPCTVPVVPLVDGAPSTQLFPAKRSGSSGGKATAAKGGSPALPGHEPDAGDSADEDEGDSDGGGGDDGGHDGDDHAPIAPVLDLVAAWHEGKIEAELGIKEPPLPPPQVPPPPEPDALPAGPSDGGAAPGPAPKALPARGFVGKADFAWEVPNGVIRYCGAKQTFVAARSLRGCSFTRSARGYVKRVRDNGKECIIGRPVGFLGSLLAAGSGPGVADKASHASCKLQERLDRATRLLARASAKADPEGSGLLGEERPKDDGELSEAESVGGFAHCMNRPIDAPPPRSGHEHGQIRALQRTVRSLKVKLFWGEKRAKALRTTVLNIQTLSDNRLDKDDAQQQTMNDRVRAVTGAANGDVQG